MFITFRKNTLLGSAWRFQVRKGCCIFSTYLGIAVISNYVTLIQCLWIHCLLIHCLQSTYDWFEIDDILTAPATRRSDSHSGSLVGHGQHLYDWLNVDSNGASEESDEEYAEEDIPDKEKYSEQLIGIGILGREVPEHSLPTLARFVYDKGCCLCTALWGRTVLRLYRNPSVVVKWTAHSTVIHLSWPNELHTLQ